MADSFITIKDAASVDTKLDTDLVAGEHTPKHIVTSLPPIPIGANHIGEVAAVGTKSNNGGVPGTNNMGVLPVLATAIAPTYTEGNLVALSSELNGRLRVGADVLNGSGASAVPIQDGGNSITVDGAVIVSGTVSVTEPVSVDDNGGSLTVDGTVAVSSLPALVAGAANIGDVDIASFAAGAITEVQGDVAHDAVVGGNPVLLGAEARTSDGTPVASGDATRVIADTLGKPVVLLGAVHDLQSNGTLNRTDTTAADIIAAAGAGVRIAVTSILVTNAHATVGTKVEIRDGTTVKILALAAAAGGGFSLSAGGRPLFISTANTAVTARCVTTGADVDVSISGYRIAN